MKFYMVVNYYLVNLNLKFHEDPFINAGAQVVNARTRDVLARARLQLVRAYLYTDLHEI